MTFVLRLFLAFGLLSLLAGSSVSAASNEIREAAEKGDLTAQLRYAHALIAEQRLDDAARWLEEAEKQGSVEAVRALGALYSGAHPAKKDLKKATGYFAKAADRGDTLSQFVLATFFDQGDGVPKNAAETVRWLKLSAGGGYGPAQVRLAELFEAGVPGVLRKSPVDAYALYRKALDTAMGEVSSFIDSSELLARIERLKRGLSEADLRQAMARGSTPFSELLPRFHPDRRQFVGNGSGFLITEDGYLVTNHHVVEGMGAFSIKSVKGVHQAQVVDVDADNDLALLKTAGDFTPVPIVNSDLHAKPGHRVFVYGYPDASLSSSSLGQEEPKFADGAIGAAEFVSGLGDKGRDLSITVPLIGGNSGGALFDFRGNVIGVAVATRAGKVGYASINYAVKSSRLLRFLDKHPKVKAALTAPTLVERRPEEVVAEVRQSVVLVGGYVSPYEYALNALGEQRAALVMELFRKATGNDEPTTRWDSETIEQFKAFRAKLPAQEIAEILIRRLFAGIQNLDWTEAEAKDAVQKLVREKRL